MTGNWRTKSRSTQWIESTNAMQEIWNCVIKKQPPQDPNRLFFWWSPLIVCLFICFCFGVVVHFLGNPWKVSQDTRKRLDRSRAVIRPTHPPSYPWAITGSWKDQSRRPSLLANKCLPSKSSTSSFFVVSAWIPFRIKQNIQTIIKRM